MQPIEIPNVFLGMLNSLENFQKKSMDLNNYKSLQLFSNL